MSKEDELIPTVEQSTAEQDAIAETVLNPIEQIHNETPIAIDVPTSKEINEHELIAEQFDNYLRIAKALMRTLKRPKDIEICSNLMLKVERLNNSKHLEVKRNNNGFFRYYLKVLNWTSINQPIELYKCWYNRNQDDAVEPRTESRTWLEENKSYLAIKSLKDGTCIFYSAISDNPQADWQVGGLNILAKQGAYHRN